MSEGLEVETAPKADTYKIEVDFDDPRIDMPDQPFTMKVRQGGEIRETFTGLTTATVAERVNAESKIIVVTEDVEAKIGQALRQKKLLKGMSKERYEIRQGFAELVNKVRPLAAGAEETAAQRIERREAEAKLRVFASRQHANPELAMKLAQMNRAQRQAFFSNLRHEKARNKRGAERHSSIQAKKALRR